MTDKFTARRDLALLFLIAIGAGCFMVRSHWQSIDEGRVVDKLGLHSQVLANEAKDPYQYKLWPITQALDWVGDQTGADGESLYRWNTLFGVFWLLAFHALWLRCFGNGRAVLMGTLTLVALAHVLFLDHFHHPYEFWGVGLGCFLLRGIHKDWDWRALCALALVTGLVWEKHALLAPVYGLYRLRRGDPLLPAALRAFAILAAALVAPIVIRLYLDGQLAEGVPRLQVDGDTPFDAQKWHIVLWNQGSYILPFLAILLLRLRSIPSLVRVAWIQLPLLVAAYLYKDYIIHEVRSFWALAPVFTATLVCWWSAASTPTRPLPAPPKPDAPPA